MREKRIPRVLASKKKQNRWEGLSEALDQLMGHLWAWKTSPAPQQGHHGQRVPGATPG